MKKLMTSALILGMLAAPAFAQTGTPIPGSRPVGAHALPNPPPPPPPIPPERSATSQSDTSAASGNDNQAVATTSANAPQPAKGANSFTEGEAASRLAKNGFTDVSGLKKDDNGVWRGTAKKAGQTADVWLDYKGNTGAMPTTH